MINIPQATKQWSQTNKSDLLGNIFVTKNVTFDDSGYLTLSNSPRSIMNELVDTDFNNVSGGVFTGAGNFLIQTWEEPFSLQQDVLTAYPTQVTTTNYPAGGANTDVKLVGSQIVGSEPADLTYGTASVSSFTDTNISLTNTSGSQHPVLYMPNIPAMIVADVNTVKSYEIPLTSTPVLLNTLTLPLDSYVTGTCYLGQNAFIATRNIYGGHAYVYVWNGLSTAAQQIFEVNSNIIFDIVTHDNTIFLITGNGTLKRFNGGSFETVGIFPIAQKDVALTDYDNINMYKGIMKSRDDLLYINFSGRGGAKRLLNMPDGIWCFDKSVGLYHRYASSMALVNIETIASASVNTTTNIITVTTAPITGTEVYFKIGNGLDPLLDNTKYFVIKISDTTIKLAETKANALLGTAIDLTSVTGDLNKFIFFPNIDYGATFSGRTTANIPIERPTRLTQYGTDTIWGSEVEPRTLSGGDANLITVSSGVEARGYYITPKIYSNNVLDVYNQLTLKFSEMTSELDKIIIKYRHVDDRKEFLDVSNSTFYEGTWTSTTTFTSSYDFSNSEVGDEVEILAGAGGGLLSHIVTISDPVAGVYTITIEDPFDNYISGDKCWVVARNWKKHVEIAYGDTNALQSYYSKQFGKKGKFIQFKIELRGIQTRLEELLVDNTNYLPLKK